MPRLILIDHSLKRADGHHYDYVRHALTAASELGWTTVLATHRRLVTTRCELMVSAHLPLFRDSTYSRYTLAKASQWPLVAGPRDWRARSFIRGRQRHIDRFAAACHQLFAQIGHEPGDQVFLPTVSELDVLSLAHFLRSASLPSMPCHLQFHLDLVEDDIGDEGAQMQCVQWLGKSLHDALRHLGPHRLHFYTTTEPLRREHQQLAINHIRVLPYPVHPELHEHFSPFRRPGPLRIVCPGGPRQEKGHDALRRIAKELAAETRNGSVCFLVQTRRVRPWTRLTAPFRAKKELADLINSASGWCDLPHPVSASEYVQLIRDADIGLLMYERHRYISRRAGVLGEFLTAGVPVVVPSACWLADQIADVNHDFAEQQIDEAIESRAGTWRPETSLWEWEGPVPHSCRDVVISWRRATTEDRAAAVLVALNQLNRSGLAVAGSESLHGARNSKDGSHNRDASYVLARIHPEATSIRCECRLAGAPARPAIEQLTIAFLSADQWPEGRPLGVVGRSVNTVDEATAAIREIITHYDHYRQTARQFSEPWFREHNPRATILELTSSPT